MIDARGDFENLAPRGIKVNEYDMLNLFVDAKLWSEPIDPFRFALDGRSYFWATND